MSDKGRRPRIVKEVTAEPLLVNSDKIFGKNCSTDNGWEFHSFCGVGVKLWLDKHCYDRQIFGDENGARNGIDLHLIQDLAIRSFKYLLALYTKNPTFKFIKYAGAAQRDNRILLQEENANGDILNVVIECHHYDICEYEITVKTAMVVPDFRISDNQIVLQINETHALLMKFINKQLVEQDRLAL